MIRGLIALCLLIPPSVSAADQPFSLPLFTEGLNTRHSANSIQDQALAEALNVVLDEDVNGVVVRRNGIAKYNATAIGNSKTVRGLWTFDATDGTKYFVAFSSASFYKSIGDGLWSAITGLNDYSLTANFDCTQTLGKLWCLNGIVVFSWDGTSTATITTAPLGTLVGNFRNRVLIAGISGQKGRLRLSGELDGTDWTTGANSTSPANIAVGGVDDGLDIRSLMGTYQDVSLIGKEDSLWGLYGFDRNDFQLREISREVGVIEDSSVREKNNCLYWLSKRGLEKFCGASIERISDPIRDQIDTIIATAGNARTAVDNLAADFEAGNLTASGVGAPMSSTISPGSLVPTTFSILTSALNPAWEMVDVDTTVNVAGAVDNFDDGNITAGDVIWTVRGGTWSVNANYEVFGSTVYTGAAITQAATITTAYTTSTGTWSFIYKSTASEPFSGNDFIFLSTTTDYTYRGIYGYGATITPSNVYIREFTGSSISSLCSSALTINDGANHRILITRASSGFIALIVDGSVACTATDTTYTSAAVLRMIFQGSPGQPNHTSYNQVDSFRFPEFYKNQTSTIYDTGLTTAIYSGYSITGSSTSTSSVTFHVQTSTANDGGGFTSFEDVVLGSRLSTLDGKRYVRHRIRLSPPETTTISSITAVSLLATTTGYFISQCRNPGTGITSWGNFSCNTVANGGSFTFYISTGSSCNQVTRTTATWNTQVNNSAIAIATSSYVAYRILFTVDSGSQAPAEQDCTLNWREGESRPPVATSVYKDRYHLAYTSSTASSAANDHELVLDKNDKWTLFDNMSCYSMAVYQRKLYCGASTASGQVWQQDIGTDDDGASFTSRIKTKAFNFGMPEARKTYSKLYLDLEPEANASDSISLSGAYYLDRGTTSFSLGSVDLGEDSGHLITAKLPFPTSNAVSSRYLQLELSATGLNQPFRLFGGRLYLKPLRKE